MKNQINILGLAKKRAKILGLKKIYINEIDIEEREIEAILFNCDFPDSLVIDKQVGIDQITTEIDEWLKFGMQENE